MKTKRILFSPDAFEDYKYWVEQDKKTLKRMFEMWKGIHLMVLGNLNL